MDELFAGEDEMLEEALANQHPINDDVITDGSRLWQADMAARILKDLGIEQESVLVGPSEFVPEMISESFLYEEEAGREQENFHALQEDREDFFAERDF